MIIFDRENYDYDNEEMTMTMMVSKMILMMMILLILKMDYLAVEKQSRLSKTGFTENSVNTIGWI